MKITYIYKKEGIEEPRLVIVYEGIERQEKRVILKNKKHFGGIYKGKIDDLWEEVLTYIENNYDTEYLEKVIFIRRWSKVG